MQNAINYSDILNSVKTRADFNSLTKELDLLANSVYDLKADKRVYSDFIMNALKLDSKENIVKGIKEELVKIKFMEITLYDEPNQKLLDKVFDLVRSDNKYIAIDIKVDKNLIGGATISFNGKFMDGSFKTILNKHV